MTATAAAKGRLVEVAMQETVYSSLASSFEYYHRTGEPPPRAGNRQAALSSTPYNVYPAADGYVAIHVVTEGHWKNLIKAMGREELGDDPRFRTNADRVQHMDETDAVVSEWTRTLPKMEVFARLKAGRVPCAPVRTAPEVMHDPHMHERGMLAEIDHPELGPITLADLAAAAARAGQGAGRAEPDSGPAQRRDLWRLARPVGSGTGGAEGGGRDLEADYRETTLLPGD